MTSDEHAKVPSTEHLGPQPAAPAQQARPSVVALGPGHRRAACATRWRQAVSIVVVLAGIGVLSAGFWLIRSWAGLIVLGAGMTVVGFASSPRCDRREEPR